MLWAALAIALFSQAPQAAPKASPKARPPAAKVAAPALRVELPLNKPCTSPVDAVRLALADARSVFDSGGDPRLVRYVWVPDWHDPELGFGQVSHVANSTFTRTSNLIRPLPVADGRLVRIELEKYAGDPERIGEIVSLYERLAPRDSYFNTPLHGIQGWPEPKTQSPPEPQPPAGPLAPGDQVEANWLGQWRPGKLVSVARGECRVEIAGSVCVLRESAVRPSGKQKQAAEPAQQVFRGRRFGAEFYLGPSGEELFDLLESDVPIMRLDEWVAFTFSTVNGGLYYELAGVEKNLADTVAKFAGADAAAKVLRQAAALREAQDIQRREGGRRSIREIALELDAELAKSKALMNESGVTGRQRLILFVAGSAVPPTEGMQIVAVTYDVGEATIDPNADPARNLDFYEQYDGGEAILAMPNGMLLYVVFDSKDEILASVPDFVAHDFQAKKVRPNAATTRVFSGVSCANCHDATERNWGWQPVRNDVYDDLQGITLLLGARQNKTGSAEKLRELQRLASAYRADTVQLTQMLDSVRLSYQRAVHRATGQKTSKEVVAALADSYWGYWYDAVTPEVAARDLGQVFDKNAAQAFLLREIEPAKKFDLVDVLREDRILAILKDSRQVTPAQWRAIYPIVAARLIATQELKLGLGKPGPPIPPEEP